jgi:hypothetical protein
MSQNTRRERGDYTLPGMYDPGYKVMGPEMYNKILHFQGSLGELRVFLFIYKEGPSWGDEWWPMSKNFIAKGTGILPKYIPGYIRSLLARRMIYCEVEHVEDRRGCIQKTNSYAINPNVDEWQVVPKEGLPQQAKAGSPQHTHLGSPKNSGLGSPKEGTQLNTFLKTNTKDMSVTNPGRASLIETLRRNHPPSDKEKAEFLRILGEFYKEHPHRDLCPSGGDYLYKHFTERYPDVNPIFVLQKKFEAWRKKAPECFRQKPKNSKTTQEQNPCDLLDTALSKEQQRIKESGR